jgi:hypothetical protein
MSALPGYDTWKLACPDDERDTPDMTPNLDEMVASTDSFDNWLSNNVLPQSVAGLLSLILDRGLPRMDKSERDDLLRDRYDACIERVRDDFDDWAQQPARGKAAPVDQWIAEERWPR